MKPLTTKQIELLPALLQKTQAKKDRRSAELADILARSITEDQRTKLTANEYAAVKLAVQIFQADYKKEKLLAEQRSRHYQQQKAERAALTREKILLGSALKWVWEKYPNAKINFKYGLLLFAVAADYFDEKDAKFLIERYQITKHRATPDIDKFSIYDAKINTHFAVYKEIKWVYRTMNETQTIYHGATKYDFDDGEKVYEITK